MCMRSTILNRSFRVVFVYREYIGWFEKCDKRRMALVSASSANHDYRKQNTPQNSNSGEIERQWKCLLWALWMATVNWGEPMESRGSRCSGQYAACTIEHMLPVCVCFNAICSDKRLLVTACGCSLSGYPNVTTRNMPSASKRLSAPEIE